VGAKNGSAQNVICILYKPLVCDGIKPDQRREKRGSNIYLCVFRSAIFNTRIVVYCARGADQKFNIYPHCCTMATLFPPSVVKAGKIDCRVGFDCAKKEHRARSSESDDSSNERLTPPHVFVESPIKKMLLNELIREHEKELQREEKKSKSSADLVASERTRNLDKNKRMKKLKIFNDDDDETEDEEHLATQRSTSSSDACVVNLSFHHNFSEPIPIPVADLQLRCALRDENVFDTFFPALFSLSLSLLFFDIFVVQSAF